MALSANLPYDPVKDFAFISTVTSFPLVIAVRTGHPAKTLGHLIDMTKTDARGKSVVASRFSDAR